MFVGGFHNMHGSGLGIGLISPEQLQFKLSIWMNYNTLNNEVENEALFIRLRRALLLHAEHIQVFSDSQ